MSMTLQEMAERVAAFCNASHIDSINDTDEAMRIATIIKETYESMILSQEIQTALELFTLQSVSQESAKTSLILPETALTLDIVKYTNKHGKLYSPIYMEPMDFIEHSLERDVTADNVETVVDVNSGVTFNIFNDRDPQYYTIMAGRYVVFDSYNADIENTIQGRHCVAYGHTMPVFELEDTFIPDLQEQQFPVLISRAKVAADMELRNNFNQVEHDKGKKMALNITNDSKSFTRGNTRWNNRITFRV